MALEKAFAGSIFHGGVKSGITMKAIAAAIICKSAQMAQANKV